MMGRVGIEDDLYRRVQQIEDVQQKLNQSIIQGASNPYVYAPCDYAATGNVTIANDFLSITDVAPGAATLPVFGGMRILLFMQTNKVENGIYELSGVDGKIYRANDMPDAKLLKSGAHIFVINGYYFGNRDFFIQGAGDKVVGSSALTIKPPVGTVINVQNIRGYDETYSGGIPMPYTLDRGPNGTPMQISYTPPVDVWWDVSGLIGIVRHTIAAYAYAYGTINLNTADVDGIQYSNHLITQADSVNQYEGRNLYEIFKLAAGTAYNITLTMSGGTAGEWIYYRSPSTLKMSARAIVR